MGADPVMRMREPYFILPAPTAWPRGKECILDYDGYVLGDMRRADRIVIESIGGLTGPDLAGEAEKNPDRDGETPSDLNYGGRTITLRGFVSAGTLEGMRTLFSYVLDAFDGGINPSAERRLWFRWLDWRDFFVDSNALVDYAYDAGSGTLSIAADGSGLQPTSTAAKEIVLHPARADDAQTMRYTYGDGEVVIGFKAASSMTGVIAGVVMRRTADDTKLVVRYRQSTGMLELVKVVPDETLVLDDVSVAVLSVATSYYVRARIKGDLVTYSIWDVFPPDVGGTPMSESSFTLPGDDFIIFPDDVEGMEWGLVWTPNSTSDRFNLLDIAAIDKGDAVAWCRKVAQVEGDETQDNERFTRPFAVALRASDARFVSRKPTAVSITPSDFALIFPGDGSGLIFPVDGSGLIFGGALDDPVVNLGRSPASPIIRLHGPMTNPAMTNASDGRKISVDGSIAFGDYYEFDNGRHTVVDATGASVYRSIGDDTNWISLPKGESIITLGADSITDPSAPGEEGYVEFVYRHSSR